jgi:hypothetical protein
MSLMGQALETYRLHDLASSLQTSDDGEIYRLAVKVGLLPKEEGGHLFLQFTQWIYRGQQYPISRDFIGICVTSSPVRSGRRGEKSAMDKLMPQTRTVSPICPGAEVANCRPAVNSRSWRKVHLPQQGLEARAVAQTFVFRE